MNISNAGFRFHIFAAKRGISDGGMYESLRSNPGARDCNRSPESAGSALRQYSSQREIPDFSLGRAQIARQKRDKPGAGAGFGSETRGLQVVWRNRGEREARATLGRRRRQVGKAGGKEGAVEYYAVDHARYNRLKTSKAGQCWPNARCLRRAWAMSLALT